VPAQLVYLFVARLLLLGIHSTFKQTFIGYSPHKLSNGVLYGPPTWFEWSPFCQHFPCEAKKACASSLFIAQRCTSCVCTSCTCWRYSCLDSVAAAPALALSNT
jgi:hypothetical protein